VVSRRFDRVMAYPQLNEPMSGKLATHDRQVFLPGADDIPNDCVLLLKTNPRFVESFMAGLNAEMGRELLWRGFPTDRRGTPFRYFWDRVDDKPDIDRGIWLRRRPSRPSRGWRPRPSRRGWTRVSRRSSPIPSGCSPAAGRRVERPGGRSARADPARARRDGESRLGEASSGLRFDIARPRRAV
jgi:hypothetical protein